MALAGSRRGGKGNLRGAPRLSNNKANAAGYAKRKSRSVKAISGISDVYNFEAPKTKRANIKLTLDREEEQDAGYGDEDEEELENHRKPRLIGEGEEEDRIGSDEDEEIDSDDAFEEEDDIRFAEFDFMRKKGSSTASKTKQTSQKQSSNGVRFAEVDLNEDEVDEHAKADSEEKSNSASSDEEEEEGEDDEFIDVLDVLDGRGEPDFGDENAPAADAKLKEKSKGTPSGRVAVEEANERSGGEEDEEEEDNEDEDSDEEQDMESDEDIPISGDESDSANPSALDKLDKLVSGLETGSKRKADDEDGETADVERLQSKKKKRLAKDTAGAGIESEFGAKASAASKLSLDDLLAPLASKQETLSSLKKSLKPLTASSKPKNQPLPAPLPIRTQEKLDRAAAYEQTKEEVDKWSETMKRIREAEHLSFPLQAPKPLKTSNLELSAKFKPTTELESSIDKLLKSAKLREEDIAKTEELMMKDLTVEEVAERRAELRKMRELTFRAEVKAKRVSKIKSKAYRRIQKKAKEKLMAKLDAGAEGELDDEEARMKAEIERARERATLKHKNTGKWAKAMKGRKDLDEDQRRDISEMLDRGERLRRRIQGQASGSEDEEGDSSDDELNDDEGIIKIKSSAFEELQKLREEDAEDDNDPSSKLKAKSVFQMKFMKDAAARQNREANKMIDDFTKEMGVMTDSDNEGTVTAHDDILVPVERVNGRMVFRPGPQVQTNEKVMRPPPPPPSAISETSTMKSHDSVMSPVNEFSVYDGADLSPPPPSTKNAAQENPWLSISDTSSSKVAKRSNEVVLGKDSSLAQKSEMMLKKQIAKTAGTREKEVEDATLEITTGDAMVLKKATNAVQNGKKKKKKNKGKDKEAVPAEDDSSEENSELDEQEAALNKTRRGLKAFEQRELVARAFAGDNVVKQFEEAKRREMESDAPKEVDTTLPGWGSWGGSGTKKAPKKPNLIKKVAGIDPKSRADYGKAHVIISEKRDKKAAKFATKDLPHPYTSKAQYEASMDTPLGSEWNTRLGFQRGTLPKIVKKMGTIIDPLEKVL